MNNDQGSPWITRERCMDAGCRAGEPLNHYHYDRQLWKEWFTNVAGNGPGFLATRKHIKRAIATTH